MYYKFFLGFELCTLFTSLSLSGGKAGSVNAGNWGELKEIVPVCIIELCRTILSTPVRE